MTQSRRSAKWDIPNIEYVEMPMERLAEVVWAAKKSVAKSKHPDLTRNAFRDFYVIDDDRVLTPEYTSENKYVGLSEVVNDDGRRFFIGLKNDLKAVATPVSIDPIPA